MPDCIDGFQGAPSGPYAETENLEGGEEESQDELVERQEAFDEGEREVEEETEEECQVMDEMTGEEVSASDRNYQVQDIVGKKLEVTKYKVKWYNI